MTDNFIVVLGLLLGLIVIVLVARLIQNKSLKNKTQELAVHNQELALNPNLEEMKKQMMTESRLKKGAGWFFWIAGLSILNSIIGLTGGGVNFILGLGLSQIIDAIASIAAEDIGSSSGTVILAIGFVLSSLIAGAFVVFGLFARKGKKWAFIIGMILYGLDGLIFIGVGDLLSIGFHVFALFGLFGGLKALNEIDANEQLNVKSLDKLKVTS